MAAFVRVAGVNDVPEGACRRVEVDGHRIALVRLADGYFAVDDTCTHAEASLCEGEVSGDELVCPLHFATFNVRTGECTGPPAEEDLVSYPVRVNGDDIEIEI